MTRRQQSIHGMTNTRLYRVWSGMLARCGIPSASNYRYYGGRGIKVCEEWQNSAKFFAWAVENGYQDGLEIDRIDTNGDYEPGNCQFITHVLNSQKRRNGRCTMDQAEHVKTYLAAGCTVMQAAKAAGVPYMSAWHISKGNTWR